MVDTPIWINYESAQWGEVSRSKLRAAELLVSLYRAVTDRDNYYQNGNTPTAFGDPNYSYKCGILHGILIGAGIQESEENGKRIFRRGNRTILVVDILTRPHGYYDALKDNRVTRRALGF